MNPEECLAILSQRAPCNDEHRVGRAACGGEDRYLYFCIAYGHDFDPTSTAPQNVVPRPHHDARAGYGHGQNKGGEASDVDGRKEPPDFPGGQVINLSTGANESTTAVPAARVVACGEGAGPHAGDGEELSRGEKKRNERLKEIKRGLEAMSTGEVVQAFTRAQEERVALYRKFDGGLKEMLQSGDYSAYPPLCVDVTAGFSLLSQAINMMEAMLKTTLEGKAAGDIIHRVQQEEEQKLTLTAALHLELIRRKQNLGGGALSLGLGPGLGSSSGVGHAGLLEEGVKRLTERVEDCAAAVRGLLEDLRYEM